MSFAVFSKKKNIVYSIFIALTVILSSVLFIWTLTETNRTAVVLFDAKAVIDDSVITEYIVGEKVNTDGVKMYLNGKEVEYTAEADFSTAGIKAVYLSYEDKEGKHVASYPVNVYSVKHFDLRSFPLTLYKSRNEYIISGLTVWAALSDDILTDRFLLTIENPKWYNTIQLTNEIYTLTHTVNEQTGIVKTAVSVGSYKDVISFDSLSVEGGFDFSKVNGAIKVMPLYNQSEGSQNKLTLFIKTATTDVSVSDRKMEASGVYVYERHTSSGISYEYYNFSYYMDGGWGSHFESELTETMQDTSVENYPYFIDLNGETFMAGGTDWRAAFIVV